MKIEYHVQMVISEMKYKTLVVFYLSNTASGGRGNN